MKLLTAGRHELTEDDVRAWRIGLDATDGDVTVVLPPAGYGGTFQRLDNSDHTVVIETPRLPLEIPGLTRCR